MIHYLILLLCAPISAMLQHSTLLHELNHSTNISVVLDPNGPSLFCFQPPSFIEWLYHCLNDFQLSLHLSTTHGLVNTPTFKVFDGLDEHFFTHSPITPSCSLLDETSSSNSKSSSFLSFLFSSEKSKTIPISHVRYFTSPTLEWVIPSYPPTCFAVCSDLPSLSSIADSSAIETLLTVKISSNLNVRSTLVSFAGLFLLLSANYISNMLSFYYVSGLSFVLLGSVLILAIIFIRLMPLRRGGTVLQSIFVLLGGTFSLIFMCIDYMRSSVLQILASNMELTSIYLVSVTFLTLLLFYWFHLPERLVQSYPRTKKIMNYFLRIFGAILLLSSLHMPFVEEELLSKSLSHFLYLFNISIDQTNPMLKMTKSVSPKIVRLLLALGLLFSIDLFKIVFHLFCKGSTVPSKLCDMTDACGNLDDASPSKGRIHLPGSPWASSSPYYYAHPSTLQPTLRRSTDFTYSRHTPTNKQVAVSDHDTARRRWSSINAFTVYSSGVNEQQAILTDDESD